MKQDTSKQSVRGEANPLSVAFGGILQWLCQREGLSSEEMAVRLGLGYSTFRLIAAGGMPFHPGRIQRLKTVCQNTDLQWGRLAQVIVAISLLDWNHDGGAQLREMWEDLFVDHPELYLKEQDWETLKAARSRAKILHTLKDAGFLDRLGTFLQKPLDQKSLPESFNEINPYLLELRVEEFKSLSGPLLTPDALARFESNRRDRIVEVSAVIRSVKTFQHNLKSHLYQWNAFENKLKGILSLEQISLEDSRAVSEAMRQAIGREVPIKCTTSTVLMQFLNGYEAFPSPSKRQRRLQVQLNNLWLYRLENPDNVVAIVDNLELRDETIEELTFS